MPATLYQGAREGGERSRGSRQKPAPCDKKTLNQRERRYEKSKHQQTRVSPL